MVEVLGEAAAAKLPSGAAPHEIGHLAWAFATLRYRGVTGWEALAPAAASALPQLTPQSCVNMAWAFAVSLYQDRGLMASISNSLCSLPDLRFLSAHSLASTAWAFAALEYSDVPLFNGIADAALRRLDEFSLWGLIHTGWSLGRVLSQEYPRRPDSRCQRDLGQ